LKEDICEDFWGLFKKNRKLEKQILINSIQGKAAESFITLEKHIFPMCEVTDRKKQIRFIAVVDVGGVDAMEDTLSELAGLRNNDSNQINAIRQSLLRFTNCKDAENKPYYYDAIKVITGKEFLNGVNT
jgi:hypothetical protein